MTKQGSKPESPDRGRSSAQRKTDAVVRLLRGEDLDTPSRELGVAAATLSSWREAFPDGGTAAMKSRPADDRDAVIARLLAKLGRLTMDNELLGRKCRQMAGGRPLASRRRST